MDDDIEARLKNYSQRDAFAEQERLIKNRSMGVPLNRFPETQINCGSVGMRINAMKEYR